MNLPQYAQPLKSIWHLYWKSRKTAWQIRAADKVTQIFILLELVLFFQDQKNQNDTFSAIEKELMMSLLNGIQSDRAKHQKKQAKKQKVSKKKMDVHFALFFRLFRRVVTHDDFLLKYL